MALSGYESLVPLSLSFIHVMFPWLTYHCTARVTIHGELKFLTSKRWVLGASDLEVISNPPQHHKGEILIRTQGLVLPDSSVEIRWQK
jgi:hypothetical protein